MPNETRKLSKPEPAELARRLTMALEAVVADQPNHGVKLTNMTLWLGASSKAAGAAVQFAVSKGWIKHNMNGIFLLKAGRRI